MEVLQALGMETEVAVLGDVTACTEMPALARHQHGAHVCALLQLGEHLPQFAPHRTRHGVELGGVRQRHPCDGAIDLQTDMTGHAILCVV
ncbi:hypothetical protein D9M68_845840 [compost metagenome]